MTRVLGLAVAALGFACFVYAAGLFAWQAGTALLTGTWTALPVRLAVDPSLLASPRLAGIAPFIPAFDWGWANHPKALYLLNKFAAVLFDRVHLGVLAAAAGWALIALGREVAARQALMLEWQARQRAERLRRIAQYQT